MNVITHSEKKIEIINTTTSIKPNNSNIKKNHHSSNLRVRLLNFPSSNVLIPENKLLEDSKIKKKEKEEDLNKIIDIRDFECSLCFRLFYKPVSTPCGHTFCE